METPARTKKEISKDADRFLEGTEVLLLGKVGEEWFAEFVIKEGEVTRYVHVMIPFEDVELAS